MKIHRMHLEDKRYPRCKSLMSSRSVNDYCATDVEFEKMAQSPDKFDICKKCKDGFEKTAHLKTEKEKLEDMKHQFKEVIDQIKTQMKPIMDKWEVEFFEYIHELKDKFKNWTEQYKIENNVRFPNPYIQRNYKDRIGYTRSIENLLMWSIEEQKKRIHKEAEQKLLKIDVAVTKKLKNIKVEKIEPIYMRSSSIDGYAEGSWKINNEYIFGFHVIYAGGYNIQCLHYRTIYTLKKIK